MLSFISNMRHRMPLSTYPPGRTSSPQAPVYLVFQPIRFTPAGITDGGVSSYLTISPLPENGRYRFCGTVCHAYARLPVRKYGALCCPDFPQPSGRDNSVFLFDLALLPFAYCLLPIAFCLLPFAYCLIIQHHRHNQHQNIFILVMLHRGRDESGT